jgi:L-seryl-tRNA(Ser) seleniumtransferase
MKISPKTNQSKLALRQIPSIQELLSDPDIQGSGIDTRYVKQILEQEVDEMRAGIQKAGVEPPLTREVVRKKILAFTLQRLKKLQEFQLKKVINGTGIILHTNLGRAPLADSARRHLFEILDHYCNLEIDLDSGKRGDRTFLVEEIICLVTGAESALVVNNNAAAILLVLNSLCRRKEVPVSRGELVEIGGSFRMPEVMKAGMVKMVEIGTTNKTHFRDYSDAITARTSGILKVHTSNYRVMGFTQSVPIEDLVNLANRHRIPLIYDMGSGVIEDLEDWGFSHEPVARDYVKAGVDVVTFSADKVLGGPQAGIIIGKKKYLQKIKKNHLMRALRCDKLTYALLDATLRLYLQPGNLQEILPVAGMLNQSREVLLERGNALLGGLKGLPVKMELIETHSQMGSGALPLEKIPAVALSVIPTGLSVTKFAKAMRINDPAIIGYIEKDALLLNLRTIRDDEIPVIIEKIRFIFEKS